MNGRIYRTEAVVIRHRNLGEADRILTLFSLDQGKFDAVAKGVRRPGSRKAGHVEVLERVALQVARGRNLDIITQAEGLEAFLPVREEMRLLAPALYTVELVDRFTVERAELPQLYLLLIETLRRLAAGQDVDLSLRAFELGLLRHTGYLPELQRCVQCAVPLAPVVNAFSPVAGGAVCPACNPAQSGLRPLSVNALKVLRLLARGQFAEATSLRLGRDLVVELEQHLRAAIRVHLDRDLQSLDFMHATRRDAPRARPSGVLS